MLGDRKDSRGSGDSGLSGKSVAGRGDRDGTAENESEERR